MDRGARTVARVAIAAALLVVAAVNITLSVTRADAQAITEQRVQREFSAAVALVRNDSPLATSDALPIRDVAPDLTVGDIEADLRQGLATPIAFTRADMAAVKASLAPR